MRPMASDKAYTMASDAKIGSIQICMSNQCSKARWIKHKPGGRMTAPRKAEPATVKVLRFPSIAQATNLDAGKQIAIVDTISPTFTSKGVPTEDKRTIPSAAPKVLAVALKRP